MSLPCRLTDLNPNLEGTLAQGALWFDCPWPGCDHRVRIAISDRPPHRLPPPPGRKKGPHIWQARGDGFANLTVRPSINICSEDADGNPGPTLCWHGFIRQGEVT